MSPKPQHLRWGCGDGSWSPKLKIRVPLPETRGWRMRRPAHMHTHMLTHRHLLQWCVAPCDFFPNPFTCQFAYSNNHGSVHFSRLWVHYRTQASQLSAGSSCSHHRGRDPYSLSEEVISRGQRTFRRRKGKSIDRPMYLFTVQHLECLLHARLWEWWRGVYDSGWATLCWNNKHSLNFHDLNNKGFFLFILCGHCRSACSSFPWDQAKRTAVVHGRGKWQDTHWGSWLEVNGLGVKS